jgi:hypothetical protein
MRFLPPYLCLLLGVALSSLLLSSAGAADAYSEDAVKAAYLYRFAGYVNWPESQKSAPFIIAVFDSSGVARELRHLLPGHLIDNRTPQVREISSLRELKAAQILYAGAGHADSLRTLAAGAALQSVLVVTDEEGGLEAGSALNFLTLDHRVRFEASLTAADRAGVKISSELLGVAVRVIGGRRQTRDGCSPLALPAVADGGCAIRLARRGLALFSPTYDAG